jgi:hypothetical protein
MPKTGALSIKREQLERLAVMSIQVQGDVKEAALNHNVEAAITLVEAVDIYIDNTLSRFIQWSYSRLSDAAKWTELAERPADFNSEMDRYLTGLKTAMRLLYNVPDHRPTDTANTPVRVAHLKKEHPNAFWGQLKVRFKQKYNQGISDGAIERAYNRFVERVQKDMTRWGRLLREFSTQSALSDTQRLQELPTHEVVLDILTKTQ